MREEESDRDRDKERKWEATEGWEFDWPEVVVVAGGARDITMNYKDRERWGGVFDVGENKGSRGDTSDLR